MSEWLQDAFIFTGSLLGTIIFSLAIILLVVFVIHELFVLLTEGFKASYLNRNTDNQENPS